MTAADLDMSHGLVAGVWFLAAVVALYGAAHLVTKPVSGGVAMVVLLVTSALLLAAAVVAFIVAVTV